MSTHSVQHRVRAIKGTVHVKTVGTYSTHRLYWYFSLQCVCVLSSHSFWTSSSLDVPAGVTQEEGHTGFLIHLLSAVRALIFLARRIQPFLSLVDCEVNRSPPVGHFYFCFLFFY